MWYRLWRWLTWTVIGSLVPFMGLAAMRVFDLHALPGISSLFGSGQLLLTCVALTAGGIKELSGMDANIRTRARDTALHALVIFGLLIAMVYGSLARDIVRGAAPSVEQQHFISYASLAVLAVTVLVAGYAVAVSSPQERLLSPRQSGGAKIVTPEVERQ